MINPNPYDECPIYESTNFLLRLVSADDAAHLLECYSDPKAQALFNADNCIGDFKMYTLEDMNRCIEFWLTEYKERNYVRFSIVDKATCKAVGTVEIFGGEYAVLRIDICSEYENETCLTELINIADSFFSDFECDNIITKAIPEAKARITALRQNGYTDTPIGDGKPREHYYIKSIREVNKK